MRIPIICLMLLLILIVTQPAFSFDPPPRTIDFRGVAYVDGYLASDGSTVSIWANNGSLKMNERQVEFGKGYFYNLAIIWDDPDTPADEGITYDDITYEQIAFKLNGVAIAPYYDSVSSLDAGSTITQILGSTELPPKWDNISYPEGVYEPYNAGLPGTHLHTFYIKFTNLNASSGDRLECNVMQSNGAIFNVNSTMSTDFEGNYSLNYTVANSDSVSKLTRWQVINCSLYNGTILRYTSDSAYSSRLNKTILVHSNTWTRFSTSDADGYRAAQCFLGFPKRYFNNSYYCDYVGDVAFAVSMSLGMAVEGYCDDGIDGDANGDIDCDDRYCRGIPYTCIDHVYAGDPFGGTCSNGICTESKTFGVPSKTITYTYTRYVKPGGTLKVRFDGGSYNTTKPILYSITELNGLTSYGNYTDSNTLSTISSTATSVVAESTSGFTGDIDEVLWVNISGYTTGWHNISIYMIHEGQDLLITGIPIYVTSSATTNWDESQTSAYITLPCASSVDEDLDYVSNCLDSQCNGKIAGTGCTYGYAYCQYATETTCNDCFDNDADGVYDCADSNCDLQPGSYLNTSIRCHYYGEGSTSYDNTTYNWTQACADSFNNDREDGIDCYDTTYCWGRGNTSTTLPCPAYENNTALWCHDNSDNDYDDGAGIQDNSTTTGVDCADYDCRGVQYTNASYNATCTTDEAYDKYGNYVPLQCFDATDNDLDSPIQKYTGLGTNIDCSDQDCLDITHPVYNVTCRPYEYNVTWNISADSCINNLDDDGDKSLGWPLGGIDCSDPDCNKQFGLCGPCPSSENNTWDSCANEIDDDTDKPNRTIDCQDTDCLGEIGSTDSGQRCASAENTTELCSDSFDNDASGSTDCSDSNCNGLDICEYGTETTCNDQEDNDADNYIDCVDSDCYGVGTCAAKTWSSTSCTTVPANSSWETISSSTIQVRHLYRHYVDTGYTIEVSGSDDYSSVTITLGDATNSSLYFPYNATGCTLSGDTTKIKWVASQSTVGQIQDKGAFTGGFTVILSCSGLSSPQENNYSVTISNELQDASTESGDTTLTATVYENTAPTISEIEISPWNGSLVEITHSDPFKIRAVPSNDPSGICQCKFNVEGNIYTSSDGNCIYTLPAQTDDTTYTISAAARDGAYNLGSYAASTSVPVNVMPKQNTIFLAKNEPFYNASNASDTVIFGSSFTTADSGYIDTCFAWIEDVNGTLLDSKTLLPSHASTVNCNNYFDVSALSEGIYFVTINATDEDGDVITSDKKVFYICTSYEGSGDGWDCSKADFSQNGVSDLCNDTVHYEVGVDLVFTFEFVGNETLKITSIYEAVTDFLLLEKETYGASIDFSLPVGTYDVDLDVFNGRIRSRLDDISLDVESNYTFQFDMLEYHGLQTYAFEPSMNFSTSTIELYYGDLEYGNEDKIVLHKCDEWNFSTRTCLSGWYNLTTTVNTTTKYASAVVSDYSGFSVYENPPSPRWDNISYPEGVYEPYNASLAGTHLHTLYIKFTNLNASADDELQCEVKQSDGRIITLSRTVPSTQIHPEFSLNYTITDADSVSKLTRWEVVNCTLLNDIGNLRYSTIYDEDPSFGSRLNRTIFVHDNTWTRFSSSDDDAYRAGQCFLGFPKRYFNNSYYCDYVGDVAFAVSMSLGMALEGYCDDGIDGDSNGDTDCDDRYCRGIPYTCIDHTYAGDPFGGTCSNGICTESKTFGTPAKTITYTYTRYVKPDGTLKVRFDGGTYSTSKPIMYSITDLTGLSDYGNYSDSNNLDSISSTATSVAAESAGGETGDVDTVIWVNISGYSEGWHNISIYLIHHEQDLLITGIPIYVTSSATSNWDESETSAYTTSPCTSSVDEDLDYYSNCLDLQCNGSIGGTSCTGGDAYCEYGAETTCYDCFDNDQSGTYDCGDSACDLKAGDYTNTSILCHYQGEGRNTYDATAYTWVSACADSFNNDQEGNTDCYDTTYCWGRGGSSTTLPCPAYENNTASWCHDSTNNDYDSRTDCADYDCHGVSYGGQTCPTNEAYDKSGNYAPAQCFDNIDNDLDSPTQQYSGSGANIDCADPDCTGVSHPTANLTCMSQEYNETLNISASYCSNSIDDDDDNYLGWPSGGIDCSDPDCNKQFGLCGPCPYEENITWDSCANSIDDDSDRPSSAIDCADSDCLGEIGSTVSGQRCENVENTTSLCSDSFDNENDGLTDCLDSGCNGIGICEYGTESTCNDQEDNDADGYIDCVDSDCYGVATCASQSWSTTSCTTVPANSSWETIGSSTIQVRHLYRHHINEGYTVEVTGSGNYNSVTITLGDATNSSLYFPYNATTCTLSGDTTKVKWVASQSEIGQIQDQGAFTGGFSVILSCSGLSTPQTNSYSFIISNELQDASTESGETSLTATVYENTAPTTSEVEISPWTGSAANLDYGNTFKIRGIPSNDASGICQCLFNVSGTIYTSSDGNCIYTLPTQTDDTTYTISAAARDGAYNLGSYAGTISVPVNVKPKQNSISVDKTEPFYNASSSESITFTSSFTTSTSGTINSCLAWIENSSGSIVSSKSVTPSGGNTASCNNNFSLSALSDGLYYLVVNATDEDGDTVTSDKKVFYVCSSYISSGDGWTCAKADFDQDGSPEPSNCTFATQYDVTVSLTINLLTDTTYNKTISIYDNSTQSLVAENTTNETSITFTIPSGTYYILVDVYNSELKVQLNELTLTSNQDYELYLDSISASVYGIKTYTVDADNNFTSVDITFNYSNLSYSDENYLSVYKCDDWNRTSYLCSGWTKISSNTYTALDIITVNVDSLSGFSIVDETPEPVGPVDAGPVGPPAVPVICSPSWTCTPWWPPICGPSHIQERTCTDVNNCGTDEGKPAESRSCTPPPSCDDGVQNQGEEGIDCGGPCIPCVLEEIPPEVEIPAVIPPEVVVAPPVIKEGITISDVRISSLPCVNTPLTVRPSARELDYPIQPGYEIIIDPFDVQCTTDVVDLTLTIPDNYIDVQALKCFNGICNPLTVSDTYDLKCGAPEVEQQYINPEVLPLKLEKAEVKQEVFESEKYKLVIPGAPAYTISTPTQELIEPTALLATNVIEITFETTPGDTSATITLPYTTDPRIDISTIQLYVQTSEGWDVIESSIAKDALTITGTIESITPYVRANQMHIAVMGIPSELRRAISFQNVYYPAKGSRAAVIFLHGLGSTSTRYNDIIDDIRLTKQPWQVWTFDYPSNKPVVELGAAFADAMQNHNGEYEVIYIVGHSLGGVIARQALEYAYNENQKDPQAYTFINNVRKSILIAAPNDPAPGNVVFQRLYRHMLNLRSTDNLFSSDDPILQELVYGNNISRVPTIDYYVIAGTRSFDFTSQFFTIQSGELLGFMETNDGVVTVTSVQHVGDTYVNDSCYNFWEVYETHVGLLDNPTSRKIIEQIISREIAQDLADEATLGHQQYFELFDQPCVPGTRYVIIGKKIKEEKVADPTGCSCGNGYCNIDEDEVSCPVDCAVFFRKEMFDNAIFLSIMIALLIAILISNLTLVIRLHAKRWLTLFILSSAFFILLATSMYYLELKFVQPGLVLTILLTTLLAADYLTLYELLKKRRLGFDRWKKTIFPRNIAKLKDSISALFKRVIKVKRAVEVKKVKDPHVMVREALKYVRKYDVVKAHKLMKDIADIYKQLSREEKITLHKEYKKLADEMRQAIQALRSYEGYKAGTRQLKTKLYNTTKKDLERLRKKRK